MDKQYQQGDTVKISATGVVDAVYGNDKYLILVHGESVPISASQMDSEGGTTGQECTHKGHYQINNGKEHLIRWCTNCGKSWAYSNWHWCEIREPLA